jgi:hypothetical protein
MTSLELQSSMKVNKLLCVRARGRRCRCLQQDSIGSMLIEGCVHLFYSHIYHADLVYAVDRKL